MHPLVGYSPVRDWRLYLLLACAVALCLLARFHESFPGDEAVVHWVETWRHPTITDFMKAVSLIGDSWILVGIAGALAIGLLAVGRRREGLVSAGALGLLFLSPLLKWLIDRPRPPADLLVTDPLTTPSFPSGHAYQSLIVFALLIGLVAVFVNRTWLCRSLQVLLVSLILAIGLSRIYLGVHWPSDVLGGYVIGVFVLVLLLRGYRSRDPAPSSQ
jgi:undecaprenyl-diphosphatase